MQEMLKKFSNNIQHNRGSAYQLVFETPDGDWAVLPATIKWDDSLGLFWFTYDNQTLCCPISDSCIYECFCWATAKY